MLKLTISSKLQLVDELLSLPSTNIQHISAETAYPIYTPAHGLVSDDRCIL
jgi:hypothetical protein